MKFQTVVLLVALIAIAVFLIRRARNSVTPEYRKRFDSTLPQQDSSYPYVPLITGNAADVGSHHAQGSDCGTGSVDAGNGCSDGGGGN